MHVVIILKSLLGSRFSFQILMALIFIYSQVGRRMSVNGEDLLTFKYDILSATEAVYNNIGMTLLNVTYDPLGRPLRWTPTEPFVGMQLKYDRFGQMQQWRWGDQRESFTYDNNGRFESVTYADGTKMSYSYRDDQSDKVTFFASFVSFLFSFAMPLLETLLSNLHAKH